jgi:DNA-binding transcriptional MerR regulator
MTTKDIALLKIGDFARRSQVSVDTLRHYDSLGLLKPAEVDPFTGYRYYAFHQLGRLNRILALKDLGLSLEQIALMLEDEVSAEQLKGMLKLKRAEIELHIEAERERVARVEARLKQIEMEAGMPNHEVVIKNVGSQLVAGLRRMVPSYDLLPLYGELNGYLMEHGVTPAGPVTLWHSEIMGKQGLDSEATIALQERVAGNAAIKVYELPAGSMASTVHNGSFDTLNRAYEALRAWIDTNGYRRNGPAREIYLYYPTEGPLRNDDESYVTEIQFPVEKII